MMHTNEKIIKHKVGLLNLAEELGNVSKACKMMGLSRDTFYRYKSAHEEDGSSNNGRWSITFNPCFFSFRELAFLIFSGFRLDLKSILYLFLRMLSNSTLI